LKQKYLTVKEINKKYGIKTSKLYWFIRESKIIYVKIGKSVLIPEKDFLTFLDSHTKNPISDEDYEY